MLQRGLVSANTSGGIENLPENRAIEASIECGQSLVIFDSDENAGYRQCLCPLPAYLLGDDLNLHFEGVNRLNAKGCDGSGQAANEKGECRGDVVPVFLNFHIPKRQQYIQFGFYNCSKLASSNLNIFRYCYCCLSFQIYRFIQAICFPKNQSWPTTTSLHAWPRMYARLYAQRLPSMQISLQLALQQMVKVINNYTLIQKIGEGTFAEVYRAVNSSRPGQFAVKIIPVKKFQENAQLEECTLNEVKTLSAISANQHIVKYEDHFQTRNNYYFVYEYCDGGTLQSALKKQGSFSEQQALSIFRQLLEAFKLLNRFNIMHRDIKPENIFFSRGKVKLGDFGFCKTLKPGEHMAKTMLGSPIYMAPEVLRGESYTMKADIWSLGVVLYQMLFGVCPYESNSIAMLISTINSTDLTMPLDLHPVSDKTQSLLKKLLTKDYFRRISWIELFAIKIDEEGRFVEGESTPKSPFNSSNKSYSTIKDQSGRKTINDKSIEFKKESSSSKQPKIKFYSEKYMNLVIQPIQTSQKTTDKKVSLFGDNLFEKVSTKPLKKVDPLQTEFPSNRSISSNGADPQNLSKRTRLLKKHQECLNLLWQSLRLLETKTNYSLGEAYRALVQIHHKLKQISEDIWVNETDLLDVASLINYEIIQVDRQLIETKQEMLRRSLPLPRQSREKNLKLLSMKSVEDANSGKHIGECQIVPQVKDFLFCNTQQ